MYISLLSFLFLSSSAAMLFKPQSQCLSFTLLQFSFLLLSAFLMPSSFFFPCSFLLSSFSGVFMPLHVAAACHHHKRKPLFSSSRAHSFVTFWQFLFLGACHLMPACLAIGQVAQPAHKHTYTHYTFHFQACLLQLFQSSPSLTSKRLLLFPPLLPSSSHCHAFPLLSVSLIGRGFLSSSAFFMLPNEACLPLR